MEGSDELLPKTEDILTHHLDTKRWDNVTLRDGDILLGTYGKSGSLHIFSSVRQ